MDKETEALLKRLLTWANPRVEVGYAETSINEHSAKRCFAVGYLQAFQGIAEKEVVIAPIDRKLFVESDLNRQDLPILLHIPESAIFCISLLVPEKPEKVEVVKLKSMRR